MRNKLLEFALIDVATSSSGSSLSLRSCEVLDVSGLTLKIYKHIIGDTNVIYYKMLPSHVVVSMCRI